MKTNAQVSQQTQRLTGLAILSALVIVLSVFCTFVRFGPVNITLALTPIIIGGARYGKRGGTFLGGVFGLSTLVIGLLGWDGGFVMTLIGMNAFWGVLICLLKAIAAGFLAAVAYQALYRKNDLAAVVTAGVVCPVANTGIFLLTMIFVYRPLLDSMAASSGTSAFVFALFTLAGINFLVELATNLVLSSATTRIIRLKAHR